MTEGLLDPDSVDNYEAGIKYSSSNGRFMGSLTGFLIDWEGIPVVPSLTAFQGAALYFNAGEARSQGVEFEATTEVIDDLIFELSASWVDATLSEASEGLGDKARSLARLGGIQPQGGAGEALRYRRPREFRARRLHLHQRVLQPVPGNRHSRGRLQPDRSERRHCHQ